MGQLPLEDMHRLLALSGKSIVPPERPLPLASFAGAAAAAAVTGRLAANAGGGQQVLPTFRATKFNSPFRVGATLCPVYSEP